MALGGTVPEFSKAHTPPEPEAYWRDLERIERRRWLRKHAPSLAELYEGAVHLIYGTPLPGRVRLIAHAIREICNRLPERISGIKGDGTLQYKNSLDNLVDIWNKAGYSLDGTLPTPPMSENVEIPPSSEINMSPKLFRQIANLIKDHVAAREKPEEAARRLFAACCVPKNEEDQDLLRLVYLDWLEIRLWFMQKAHDSGKVDIETCTSQELQSQFERFESLLSVLVGGFYFKTMEKLDAILVDFSALDESPAVADVKSVEKLDAILEDTNS